MTEQSDTIRFFLNGRFHKVCRPAPTRTLLDYLREDAGLTGTKEGCAEGDCGACTAVVADLRDGALRFRPVNTCIRFLPTLDGKEIITVEGLVDRDHGLHPVQQAMVDCHASQCGFCTPGFVMSLFVLYRSNPAPTRADVDAALSGNLCRCTGYRPIIDAAGRMYELGTESQALQDFKRVPAGRWVGPGPLPGEREMIERLQGIQRSGTLVIDEPQPYLAPTTLDGLADCVARHPEATLLAGGTDVGLWVTKQFRTLAQIVYLGDVAELERVSVDDSRIEIGAGVSLADAFAVLTDRIPGFAEIARRFASPPICHAGTLVGNVANGSPIGDSMPLLICLGAEVLARCGAETRSVPLDAFYPGYRQTALRPGEFASHLRVPVPNDTTVVRSFKMAKRFDQDISSVCGAFALETVDGVAERIDICYGGMAAVPKRATMAEAVVRGERWNRDTIDRALAALAHDFEPIGDMRASAAYRARAAANLLERFFDETTGGRPLPRVFDLAPVQP